MRIEAGQMSIEEVESQLASESRIGKIRIALSKKRRELDDLHRKILEKKNRSEGKEKNGLDILDRNIEDV